MIFEVKKNVPYQKETANSIKDFMNTINSVYIYYEIDTEDIDYKPLPFYMWLEDVRQKLADLNNNFWQEFYKED